jgi:glutamate dehydrogenase
VAADIADLVALAHSPSIVEIAGRSGRSVAEAARTFLAIGDRFNLDDLLARTGEIKVADDYDRLAIAGAEATLNDARQNMTVSALQAGDGKGGLDAWVARQQDRVLAAEQDLGGIASAAELSVSRLTVAATRLADLARTQA